MPKYNVDKAIWLGGLKQAAGSVVTLTEAQAKYWGHALSKVEDQPAVTVAKKATAKKVDAPATAVVTEVEAKTDGAGN